MSEKVASHDSLNNVIATMKDKDVLNTKKISDKWHTFGQLYAQRTALFSVICNQNKEIAWKSKKHFDEENDPMFNDSFAVGLYTPKGVACYHCKMKDWDLFDVAEIERAPEYDGYTSEEAIERIMSITNHIESGHTFKKNRRNEIS